MRPCFYLLTATFAMLISVTSFSQSDKPGMTAAPSWITQNTIDYHRKDLDKNAEDGLIDIGYEEQVSLAEQTFYYRRSQRIISDAGVQNGSEISVSFDPAYEKLNFHSIRIIRGEESLNRLQLSKIKIIHQEKELDHFIYNGMLNAILILEDVRKGDIIEYSYSIKGFNPIFRNKYAEVLSMSFSIPVYDLYYKILVPQGRKINIQSVEETTNPVITAAGTQQAYEWHKTNVKPLRLQDYVPSWYDPFARVLVSEYNSWKEVNDWAITLFPADKTLSAGVQEKIKEIMQQYSTDAKRAGAALRFVQDEIRYMGIEMGENSHKPADPSKVFAQRFGDCKEKSYLLCCMLRAMQIEASPVLINTETKKELFHVLPSPTAFDHATIRVKLDGSYYWFDPTISYQRGDVKNIYYPDYQAALVLTDTTSGISPVPFRNLNFQHVKDYFKVTSMNGEGTLKVITTSTGKAADDARDDFNNRSTDEIMQSSKKFYSAYYEDIEADSLTYFDDDSTGVFTSTEYYRIPSFWTLDKKGVKTFSFSPFIIQSAWRRPKDKNRKMPFRLSYPAKYKEEVSVVLPEDWKVTDGELHIKNENYGYNCKFYAMFGNVYLDADFENYKDYISDDAAAKYFKDLDAYDDYASFDLTYGADGLVSNEKGGSTKSILISLLVVGGLIAGGVWWSQRR